ncbi:hypothetical protein ACUXAV_001193 [Cupriavidus metallidurans]|jgi:hypothetical protein|uniref:hypothetical protein n=1 Tax=Cupriavidus TaxID=106589 RepID=UPI000A88E5A3|nr:hypothetical protein [Cupriavidus metallidurans]MDE4919140.1 hypothetical protein [Cupriavidus metallidurans]
MSGSNWAQGWPAAFPRGMPGNGDVIDGAIQQAPQPLRQDGADWQVMVSVEDSAPTCRQCSMWKRIDRRNSQLCLSRVPMPETKGNMEDMRAIQHPEKAPSAWSYCLLDHT